MSSANALAYFAKEAETVIITDASQVGLSAVLLGEQQVVVKAVSYPTRCLTRCERFRVYLYEIKFKVLSHHKPLEVIYSKEGWVLRLQDHDFTIEYLPRPKNIADALTRLAHVKVGSKKNVADHYIIIA